MNTLRQARIPSEVCIESLSQGREKGISMSQTISQQTPPNQHAFQASEGSDNRSWQLDADRQLLTYLYAQRSEQLEQRAAQQKARARQKSIDIVESQIAMLNQAIREAEEQVTLHARQAENRRGA